MNVLPVNHRAYPGQVLRRVSSALVGLPFLITLCAAACSEEKPADGRPAPSAAAVYPVAPKAPLSYTLPASPDRWEITFQNGRVQLRDRQQFQIGYRIDTQQKPGDSELVKSNKAQGDRDGWTMEPVTVDGGGGFRASFIEGGAQRLFWFFAKGSLTGTVSVDLGAAGDTVMAKAAQDLIASWRWTEPVLTGTGPMPDPVLPFTYQMPAALVGQKQSASMRDFRYNLWWGQQSVAVITSQGEDAAATKKFYEDTKKGFADTGATIRRFDDPATGDAKLARLATLVDEGFTIKVNNAETKMPAVGAVFLYKGTFYASASWSARGTTPTPEELPALTAPFDIVETLKFRDPW